MPARVGDESALPGGFGACYPGFQSAPSGGFRNALSGGVPEHDPGEDHDALRN
jgi:hypothetical protein